MKVSRKSFLEGTGSFLLAALGGGYGMAQAAAQNSHSHEKGMPRGLTLLTFSKAGEYRLGVKTDKGILDVAEANKMLHTNVPTTVDQVLQTEEGPALNALVDAALKSKSAERAFIHESAVDYGPVVTHPEKIVCVGLNYRRHANEVKLPIPKQPVLFNKYNNALSAHNGTIKLPIDVAKKFDYEVELVIVMGKHARNVSEADALQYVAGYCVGNDFSARDLQMETGGQWMVGKTCDGFGVVGPYLVTADQVDPHNLNIECRVNGETRQSSNTSDFIFNVPQMISYISARIPLKPGDIIFTGTPEGVILGHPKDKQEWLKPGDKIACSIEKLGEQKFDLS